MPRKFGPTGGGTAVHDLPSSFETMIRPSQPGATTVRPWAGAFVSGRPAPHECGPTGAEAPAPAARGAAAKHAGATAHGKPIRMDGNVAQHDDEYQAPPVERPPRTPLGMRKGIVHSLATVEHVTGVLYGVVRGHWSDREGGARANRRCQQPLFVVSE